jgi:hypothetical protein
MALRCELDMLRIPKSPSATERTAPAAEFPTHGDITEYLAESIATACSTSRLALTLRDLPLLFDWAWIDFQAGTLLRGADKITMWTCGRCAYDRGDNGCEAPDSAVIQFDANRCEIYTRGHGQSRG